MSETLLAAIIGLIGSLAAAIIGAYVSLRVSSQQHAAAADPSQPPPRRNPLVIPFTVVSLLLLGMFIFVVANTLRPSPGAGSTTPTAQATEVAALPPTATPTAPPTEAATVTTVATATAEPATATAALPTATTPPEAAPTATAAPESASPTAQVGVYGPNQPAPLAPGVTLVFSQMQVADGNWRWQGSIENKSDQPYAVPPGAAIAGFHDSAGGPPNPDPNRGNEWPPTTPIPAGERETFTFSHNYDTLAPRLQYVELVIEGLGPGGSALTFRRMLSLGSAATPTIYPTGAAIPLAPGVSLSFSQIDVRNSQITARGTVRNDSDTPFNFRLTRDDLHFQTGSGQSLGDAQGGTNWPNGDVAPGDRGDISVYGRYTALSASAGAVDLLIDGISGYGPFTIRRPLSVGPGPSGTPTVYAQGQAAQIAPGVTLTFQQMRLQDRSLTWLGTIRNDSDTPFNFRLNKADVLLQSPSGPVTDLRSSNWPDGDIAPQDQASFQIYAQLPDGTPQPGPILLTLANISNYGPFQFQQER